MSYCTRSTAINGERRLACVELRGPGAVRHSILPVDRVPRSFAKKHRQPASQGTVPVPAANRWSLRPRDHVSRRGSRQVAFSKRPEKGVPYPLTKADCEKVNNALPPIAGLKQAAAYQESTVALIGRLFEVVGVAVMTMYGLKAIIVGAHDIPTFTKFFFEGGAPDQEISMEFDQTFHRIRESLGQVRTWGSISHSSCTYPFLVYFSDLH